jgi:hypothetical protein
MSGHRKVLSYACAVVAGVVEIGEHVEAIHSHLPRFVQMHSQDAIILILFGLLVYLISTHDEGAAPTQTGPVPSPSAIATGGNATSTGGHSTAKLAENLYIGTTAPPSTPIPQQPVKKRTLHISPIKARIAWVNEGGMYGNVFYEREEREELSSVKAIIADFRNIPQDDFSVTTWHNIKVSIFYYDTYGSEVAEVSEGHWLEHAAIKISLARHKTERLLVAIRAKDAWISLDGGDTTKLPDGIKSAKIVLHDERGEFELSFSLQMDLDVPMVGYLEAIKPQ